MASSRTDAIPADRPPLSRARVLSTAVATADAEGLAAVTMRRLAAALGVEAMSLYHHVANKDDILTGIADLVVAEIDPPTVGGPWKAEIRRTARSAFDVLLRHRWAAALLLGGAAPAPARLRWMDAILGTFRGGGFSAELTDHAYHALDSHIMGFTLWVVGMDLGDDAALASTAADFLTTLPPHELPHLVEHVEQHLRPRPDDDQGEFAFGLELLLDGLERLRDEGEGPMEGLSRPAR